MHRKQTETICGLRESCGKQMTRTGNREGRDRAVRIENKRDNPWVVQLDMKCFVGISFGDSEKDH